MQETKIADKDGVTREYAFDDYNGQLFTRDEASRRQNPGRPYRPIYSAKRADIRTLQAAHLEMWTDETVAHAALARMMPMAGWKSAH